jgi:2-keto-3-deoxy-L-rhamnonate aldolase RhmA
MSTVASGYRARVLGGEWLAGSFINLGSSVTAEIAAMAGFDWLLLDHEHGPGSDETLLVQLQAVARTPATPIVRIAANETPRFKRVLDLGAAGVMVPYVNTADEARAAVAAVRYPPRGIRGVAKFNRSAGFGVRWEDYYAHAHETLVTMAQIETPAAVENAEAIAAVDGIDVLFVGPLDLSTNLGAPSNLEDPTYLKARARVAAAARAQGKAAGILALSPAQAKEARREGFTVVALGSDGSAVTAGLQANLAALRGA